MAAVLGGVSIIAGLVLRDPPSGWRPPGAWRRLRWPPGVNYGDRFSV